MRRDREISVSSIHSLSAIIQDGTHVHVTTRSHLFWRDYRALYQIEPPYTRSGIIFTVSVSFKKLATVSQQHFAVHALV